MGRKKVERSIFMDTLDYVAKMKEELAAVELALIQINKHVKEDRFENRNFEGIGRFEDYVRRMNLRVEDDGSVIGGGGEKVWDLLAAVQKK